MSLSRLLAIGVLSSCPFALHGQTYTGRIGSGGSPAVPVHAGGTVVVAVALSDGLVLAADSRLVVTFTNIVPPYKVASDYAPKLFSIGQVAIATYGEAFISGRSIASYISEFEASLKGPTPMDVDETVKRFSTFFGAYYDKQKLASNSPLITGFIFAGYDKNGKGRLIEVVFPQPRDPVDQDNTKDKQGAMWRGQTDVIFRLIKGYDQLIGNMPAILTLPDDKKKEFVTEIGQIEYAIPFQYMMLQDGIDFALTLVQTTVDMQRFSFGTSGNPGSIPGVGGTVDVLAVTPTGLTWIRKKALTAK